MSQQQNFGNPNFRRAASDLTPATNALNLVASIPNPTNVAAPNRIALMPIIFALIVVVPISPTVAIVL